MLQPPGSHGNTSFVSQQIPVTHNCAVMCWLQGSFPGAMVRSRISIWTSSENDRQHTPNRIMFFIFPRSPKVDQNGLPIWYSSIQEILAPWIVLKTSHFVWVWTSRLLRVLFLQYFLNQGNQRSKTYSNCVTKQKHLKFS